MVECPKFHVFGHFHLQSSVRNIPELVTSIYAMVILVVILEYILFIYHVLFAETEGPSGISLYFSNLIQLFMALIQLFKAFHAGFSANFISRIELAS